MEEVLGAVLEELALEVAQELVLETVQGTEDARQLVRRQRLVMEVLNLLYIMDCMCALGAMGTASYDKI